MDMGNETAIAYLDQDGIDAGHMFRAVDRGLTQGEPAILKRDGSAAVTCAMPHLDEGLLLGADEFFQAIQQGSAGRTLKLLG